MGSPDGTVADRRRRAAVAGHRGDATTARALVDDPHPDVRAAALGALARCAALGDDELARALDDPEPAVRRRALELAAGRATPPVLARLDDPDPTVVEVAAWVCGERSPPEPGTVARLATLATSHEDALCREAAVAALGAIGDEAGLPAVLAALTDRPAVRRRAVIALAPFEGPEVDAVLRQALTDRDWQVRQAAEDLLADDGPGSR